MPPTSAADDTTPRYRSAAVARMVRMPVSTLRIWERRYRVSAPAATPAGHRLYSAADVQRLALLKQLADLGHAIGTIAALDVQALQQVAATHARTLAGPRHAPAAAAQSCSLADPPAAGLAISATAPRRYDDATLVDFAGLSSTIACECPRHVAELLMQLSHFEAYSAECEQRSPADAALHAHLRQVTAASRALFEAALERLLVHEGLMPAP